VLPPSYAPLPVRHSIQTPRVPHREGRVHIRTPASNEGCTRSLRISHTSGRLPCNLCQRHRFPALLITRLISPVWERSALTTAGSPTHFSRPRTNSTWMVTGKGGHHNMGRAHHSRIPRLMDAHFSFSRFLSAQSAQTPLPAPPPPPQGNLSHGCQNPI
jgi:hypothetical protein